MGARALDRKQFEQGHGGGKLLGAFWQRGMCKHLGTRSLGRS